MPQKTTSSPGASTSGTADGVTAATMAQPLAPAGVRAQAASACASSRRGLEREPDPLGQHGRCASGGVVAGSETLTASSLPTQP